MALDPNAEVLVKPDSGRTSRAFWAEASELGGGGTAEVTQAELDAVQAGAKGFVNHAADATVARPTGYGSIEWLGSVEPNNAAAGDTWVNTA